MKAKCLNALMNFEKNYNCLTIECQKKNEKNEKYLLIDNCIVYKRNENKKFKN